MRLCRLHVTGLGVRLGIEVDGEVRDLTAAEPVVFGSLSGFLGWTTRSSRLAMSLAPYIAAAPRLCSWSSVSAGTGGAVRLLRPTDSQEIWAAGVTYQRSVQAREDESGASLLYDRVYDAERPEIFFKATPGRTVGPGEPVRVRADSRWTVPEPELALVLNPRMQLVGYTLANDVTARDVEAVNALYLPQAKIYDGCCALGPAVLLVEGAPPADLMTIQCKVLRGGATVFSGEAPVSRLRRSFAELIGYLSRDNSFPDGIVLLTGTGVVPPDELALADGDVVEISSGELGVLSNPVHQRAAEPR